jgi:hypothetical protein
LAAFSAYNTYDCLRIAAGTAPLYTAADPSLHGTFYTAAGIAAILLIGAIVGLAMMFTRHVSTIRYYKFYLVGATFLLVVEHTIVSNAVMAIAHVTNTTSSDDLMVDIVRSVVYGVVWLAYWTRSKRVELTFGSGSVGDTAPDLVRGRRVRRSAAIAFAAAGVIALVGYAVGKAQLHATVGTPMTRPAEVSRAAVFERMAARGSSQLSAYLPYPSVTQGSDWMAAHDSQISAAWHQLPESDLVAYAYAIGSVYAVVPETLCAQLAVASPPSQAIQAFQAALGQADSATQDAVMAGRVRGAMLSLSNAPRLDEPIGVQREAFSALYQYVGADGEQRIKNAIFHPDRAPPSDLCWTLRTLYRRVPQILPRAQAAALLRGLRN